jgi:general secretion pathway protein A
VAYIFNPKLTVTELLQSICEEFHVAVAHGGTNPSTVKDYIDALNVFLLKSHAAGNSSVLIIDEAQNLAPEVLEQLRLLTNLETNERKLLQIVLIGQPELRTMLARPELEQLAQRVIARFHLDALSEGESTQYIQHRLAVAGHSGALPFDRQSLQRIQRLARGVPRRINLLCGRALLGAWANGLQRVDRKVVDRAAAEVFGPEAARATSGGGRSTAVVLGGIVLLVGVAVAAFMLWTSQPKMLASTLSAASAPSAPASSPAQAPASAPAPVQRAAPRPVEDMEALLAQLPGDINAAWRELAPSWKLSVKDGDPCQAAALQQLLCYRSSNLTVPLLRQLGRPGILTLQEGNGAPVYALLVGLGGQTATLRVAQSLHTVRLVSLGRLWRGDFATYWRAPRAYSGELREGSSGPSIDRLARQLDSLDGTSASADATVPPVLDAAMRARVRAFQRAQGLKPDGQPGPMTLMQLDAATGGAEPRLQTELP